MWNTSYCVGSTSYFRWSTSQCLYNTIYCMWNKQPSFCSSPSAAQSPKRKVAWYKLNFTLCQLRNCLFPWVSFFWPGLPCVCLSNKNKCRKQKKNRVHPSLSCLSVFFPSLCHLCMCVYMSCVCLCSQLLSLDT